MEKEILDLPLEDSFAGEVLLLTIIAGSLLTTELNYNPTFFSCEDDPTKGNFTRIFFTFHFSTTKPMYNR